MNAKNQPLPSIMEQRHRFLGHRMQIQHLQLQAQIAASPLSYLQTRIERLASVLAEISLSEVDRMGYDGELMAMNEALAEVIDSCENHNGESSH